MRFPSATCFLISVLALTWAGEVSAQQRTFTFMDVQELKRAGSWVPRSDGALMLYTVTTPDWVEASSQSADALLDYDQDACEGQKNV